MPSMDPSAFLERAFKLQQDGQTAEAELLLRSIVEAHPTHAGAWNMLGVIRYLAGDAAGALRNLSKAVALVPNANTYANLASVLFTLGRDAEGEVALKSARTSDPNSVLVLRNLGLFYFLRGRYAESAAVYQDLTRLEPGSGEIYFHLGNALWKAGDAKSAAAAQRKSLQLQPNGAAFNSLGLALQTLGEIDEAIAAFKRAIELEPEDAGAHLNLGNTLRSIARLREAMESFESSLRAGNRREAMQNTLFTSHYIASNDLPMITGLHRFWGEAVARTVTRMTPDIARSDRPLRVGFVSADLNAHAAARFLLPLFQQLDRKRFQLCLYSNNSVNDARTAQFQALASVWRDIRNLDDDQAAQLVLNDRIDVLIDLSLHSEGNRLGLFAQKPAPVQATWLGYASTTGLAAIDYRISDPRLDPDPNEDRFFVEKTIRLADCFWCFQPFDATPVIGPSPLASVGFVTFGSLNNFAKVNTEVTVLWASILREVAHSRIIMHAPRGSARDIVRTVFDNVGGIASSRIEFVEFLPTPDYLNLHKRIDIALDPFPFAGGTTTCDALWMGVPVVTLAGKTPTGRGGASILGTAGMPELIALSQEAYEKIAIDLAHDPMRLAHYRATLRDRVGRSPLTDAPRFARNFESVIRQMWRGESE